MGTGQQHATRTGHTWQPGYYCTSCEALFSKHVECEQHVHQFGGRCKRAPTKSSTSLIHASSSSNTSGWSPMLGRRGTATGSGVSSPLLRCTMCRPPKIFVTQESLSNVSQSRAVHILRSNPLMQSPFPYSIRKECRPARSATSISAAVKSYWTIIALRRYIPNVLTVALAS